MYSKSKYCADNIILTKYIFNNICKELNKKK